MSKSRGKSGKHSKNNNGSKRKRRKPLFDVIIGNPPYQDDKVGDSKSMNPVYDKFMEQSFEVASSVELITPARFLFNAGATPKQWNRERLDDAHFKVLRYEPDTSKVFNNVDVKGGIAVTYRDADREYEPIGTFIPDQTLASIDGKVWKCSSRSLNSIFRPQTKMKTSIDSEQPDERRIRPNYFVRFPDVFVTGKDARHSVAIIGLNDDGSRVTRYVNINLIDDPNLNNYKVLLPGSNGSGSLGEVLSTPLIGTPLIGCTGTFLQIGDFHVRHEAEACMKYVKTRFARVMLGVLKVTQSNAAATWARVPLQDFTTDSDIDWSQPVPDIDRQLYEKYGLDEREIWFIEEHVRSMA